jgi:hypothetical protein
MAKIVESLSYEGRGKTVAVLIIPVLIISKESAVRPCLQLKEDYDKLRNQKCP